MNILERYIGIYEKLSLSDEERMKIAKEYRADLEPCQTSMMELFLFFVKIAYG